MKLLLHFSTLSLAFAAAISNRATASDATIQAAAPTATLLHGVVIGESAFGIDNFRGIPYAQPPVGPLRLKPPVSISANFGTKTVTATASACPAVGSGTTVLPTTVTEALSTTTPDYHHIFESQANTQSEDCLVLDVQRPSGTNVTSSLPVLFYMFGGAFQAGAARDWEASQIIRKAVSLNEPFIFVAINYRLAAYGFLAGRELSADGSTNLGLRDQRLAMEWVQDNIRAFGGDPSRVTIWGGSAGAISVLDHTIINSGNNLYKGKPLFNGGIMNSGVIFPAAPVTHPKAQDLFDRFAVAAGCSSASNKLQCLRNVDFDTFQAASNAAADVKYAAANPQYLPRPDPSSSFFSTSPEIALGNGNFARIPMILGSQEDDGTVFVIGLDNLTNDAGIVDLLITIGADLPLATAQGLVSTYSTDISAGSPYRTGFFNEIYPGYKRIASVIGDLLFTLNTRITLDYVASRTKAWAYLNTFDHSLPIVGTFHGGASIAIYYGITPSLTAVGELRTRYISFVNYGDPNIIGSRTSTNYKTWVQYDTNSRQLLNFQEFGVGNLTDDFRQNSYLYLKSNRSAFRL